MATKKTTKPIIHIDEDAETRINLAMAKAVGAKSAWDLPEFKFGGVELRIEGQNVYQIYIKCKE